MKLTKREANLILQAKLEVLDEFTAVLREYFRDRDDLEIIYREVMGRLLDRAKGHEDDDSACTL